ncbi:hypothetical protein WFZ85_03230 [Flavobacterium sp. j3]|uniref:Uncharacterized protein n=1 Tax=Flavobacterium aureirubrum TaxID=3133147 RepID=A0ABU9N1M0_9FLAO
MPAKTNRLPSKGKPGGGGGVEGGGGSGAAITVVKGTSNATRIIKILFGTNFIERKSKKKIQSPK